MHFSVSYFLYLIGKQYIYQETQDAVQPLPEGNFSDSNDICSQDILSNSSLRRKLFFHGDEGTPISPVRYEMFQRFLHWLLVIFQKMLY